MPETLPPAIRPLAVVTGASSGIGHCFARRLARDGYDLAIVARRADRLEELARQLRSQFSVAVDVVAADLTDPGDLRRIETLVGQSTALTMLVNNAGLGTTGRFTEIDADRLEREIRLNVIALVRLTRAALPGMIRRGDGAVVNISSSGAFQPNAFVANYGATKAHVNSFTEALHEELRGTGVRVLVSCPGPVRTEFGQIAGVKEEVLPAFAFIDADQVVDETLAALARGAVVHVPGGVAKALATFSRLLPRALARRLTCAVGKAFLR